MIKVRLFRYDSWVGWMGSVTEGRALIATVPPRDSRPLFRLQAGLYLCCQATS